MYCHMVSGAKLNQAFKTRAAPLQGGRGGVFSAKAGARLGTDAAAAAFLACITSVCNRSSPTIDLLLSLASTGRLS
jgi:hypothetical protein